MLQDCLYRFVLFLSKTTRCSLLLYSKYSATRYMNDEIFGHKLLSQLQFYKDVKKFLM